MASDIKNPEVSKKLLSPHARGTFCHLFKAKVWEDDKKKGNEDNKGKYSICLIFDRKAQKTPEFKAMCKAIVGVAKAKFGSGAIEDANDPLNLLTRKYNNPIRPCEDVVDEWGEAFDVKDGVFVQYRTTNKPGVFDEDTDPMEADDVYWGAIFCVSYVARAFKHASNVGVHMLLNNVQMVGEGERIEGGFGDGAADFRNDDEKPSKKSKRRDDDDDDDDEAEDDDNDLIGKKRKRR